jgi:hypothetical protein
LLDDQPGGHEPDLERVIRENQREQGKRRRQPDRNRDGADQRQAAHELTGAVGLCR